MQNGGPLDIQRELKKLKQLVAGKNELKSENELLRQTVANLEVCQINNKIKRFSPTAP